MKHILKKRILPLLCVGLLLCTPHTIAYATAGGIESAIAQTEKSEPAAEMLPPVETIPPPVETPPEEMIPPTAENTQQTTYSVEVAWKSLAFDCTPLWNPDKHCYDAWKSTENPITVTNTTQNGAPIRVTLTFVPIDKMGATAAFAPCEGDPKPDDFTFSDGQVTFELPRDADSEGRATVNLFLTGAPTGQDTQQYNQIGSIKTEITPLHKGAETLETVPPGVAEIQPPPVNGLPLPKPEPPIAEKPAEKPPETSQPIPTAPCPPETIPAEAEPLPPPTAEGLPPETKTEKPEQESTPEAIPPPEQNSKEEMPSAPHTESGAPPQEKPQ